ncbi:hypothetical protein AHMF7605_04350 [Adhaeribacter arboris]|uniref:Peptidase E n=1 Tax=Adhaeribacter arboris TaxID=2072846 RepID=A0A2T2YBC4_9BACT|nr:DUF6702 family protein [Adhaeribacter arboris]PSR52807.1 hypothetical protein AHMF7605_04350 [Adhaeribacter arboris]
MLSYIYVSFLYLSSVFHPFFVSITEIRQNEKSKNLEISSRIFFDDLEKTLEKKYKVQINILKPTDQKQINNLIADYLQQQLQLRVDGKLVKLKYLGYEIEEDAAWCYLEAPQTTPVKRLEIQDAILFDQHPEQQNLVHVTIGKQRQSTKLDNPESRYTFTF